MSRRAGGGCRWRRRAERTSGAEEGRRVVIEHAAVKFVCARLRDQGDLTDGAELGGVVGQIDFYFLERLDVVGQRAGLRIIHAVQNVVPSMDQFSWLARLPAKRTTLLPGCC